MAQILIIETSLLILTLLLCGTEGSSPLYGYEDPALNLVNNYGFEEDINAITDWKRRSARHKYSDDAHTGKRSIHIFKRAKPFSGVEQKIYNVTGNKMYYLSTFLKILTDSPSGMFFEIRLMVKFHKVGGGVAGKEVLARNKNLRASDRWRQLGADLVTPDVDLDYMVMYLDTGTALAVEYLQDTVSLIEILPDPSWRQTADDNIRKHRMSNVTIRAEIPDGFPYCVCKLQVDLTRRHFGFGQAIQSERIVEKTDFGEVYRKFFLSHFTWATFVNTMKWRAMERKQGSHKVERVHKAIKFLEKEGITIRAHNIFWGKKDKSPDWVQELTGQELVDACHERVEAFVKDFKNKVVHYDVCNEWLHDTFLEEATGDPLFTIKMFNKTRELDPNGKLFINDYSGLRSGDFTSAFVDQAQEFAFRGVPVDGIGPQTHLTETVKPERFLKRLDILASAGLPLVISEMTSDTLFLDQRADRLDTALTVIFSHPAVEEIIFWTSFDQPRLGEDAIKILFEGESIAPNKAGQVLLDRLAEWQTHENFIPTAPSTSTTFPAFHGDYTAKLMCLDKLVKEHTFTVNAGSDSEVVMPLTSKAKFPKSDGTVCPS